MGVHRIRCIAPGVGRDAAERLEASLARVGRHVGERRPLALEEPWPALTKRGVLRWVLREPEDALGTLLGIDEYLVDIIGCLQSNKIEVELLWDQRERQPHPGLL